MLLSWAVLSSRRCAKASFPRLALLAHPLHCRSSWQQAAPETSLSAHGIRCELWRVACRLHSSTTALCACASHPSLLA